MRRVHVLNIKPTTPEIAAMYEDHGHFHSGDTGLDLFCPEDITVAPGESVMIKFGVAAEIVDNTCSYYLMPRSSISKTPLVMVNSIGLIDMDYRGEIMAKVRNTEQIFIADKDGKPVLNEKGSFTIEKGTRLFQLTEGPVQGFRFNIVNKLSVTKRGTGGFGSTGK